MTLCITTLGIMTISIVGQERQPQEHLVLLCCIFIYRHACCFVSLCYYKGVHAR
jgi:hypothetical protein